MAHAAFFGLGPRQDLARLRLDQLAQNPPQVLVLEGGTASEREAAALYYAAALNCGPGSPVSGVAPGACGACDACTQIMDKVFIDLLFLDGAEQSIKVDDIREVRQKVGEPPRGPGWRVVVLTEAQGLTPQAANALLKSMEEPRPGNCFLLLTPQRERLLPTLVSRSWTLTLAWPEAGQSDHTGQAGGMDEVAQWVRELERFWRTGQGFLGKVGTKTKAKAASADDGDGAPAKGKAKPKKAAQSSLGASDEPKPLGGRTLAMLVVLALSKELADILAGRPTSSMGTFLASRLDLTGLRRLDRLLETVQEALVGQVNPALTLDWMATRVALWVR